MLIFPGRGQCAGHSRQVYSLLPACASGTKKWMHFTWLRVNLLKCTQIFAAIKFSDRYNLPFLSLRRYNLQLQSPGWTRYDEIRREIKWTQNWMNANILQYQLWCNLFEGTLHWHELPRPLRGTGEDFLFLFEFAFVIVAHAQGAPVPTEPVVFNKFPSCEYHQHSYHLS